MTKRTVEPGQHFRRVRRGSHGHPREAEWIVEAVQTDAQGIRHARLVNAADQTERKTLAADVLADPSRFEAVCLTRLRGRRLLRGPSGSSSGRSWIRSAYLLVFIPSSVPATASSSGLPACDASGFPIPGLRQDTPAGCAPRIKFDPPSARSRIIDR